LWFTLVLIYYKLYIRRNIGKFIEVMHDGERY